MKAHCCFSMNNTSCCLGYEQGLSHTYMQKSIMCRYSDTEWKTGIMGVDNENGEGLGW